RRAQDHLNHDSPALVFQRHGRVLGGSTIQAPKSNAASQSLQRCQNCPFQVVPVEQAVGIERDQASIGGMHDVYAALLDRPYVEPGGVHELHDDQTKHVFVAEFSGRGDTGQAAQQVVQAARAGLGRVVRRSSAPDVFHDSNGGEQTGSESQQ